MSKQIAHPSSRPRKLPVYVPNTVTRQRYIIRTRAQAQHLGRQPLRDALTNSPTKMSNPSSSLLAYKDGHKSGGLSRKRALSPSVSSGGASVKRLKPLVLSATPNPSVTPVSSIKVTQDGHKTSESFVPKPSTPPGNCTQTAAVSADQPRDHTSPKTVRPISIIDIFDAEPVSLPQESKESHHISPSNAVHKSDEQSDVVEPREAQPPLPSPKLFEISMSPETGQIAKADTSQLRRKYSILGEDETVLLESPSKKAKTSTGSCVKTTPKSSSMIPRRVFAPGGATQPKITSFLSPMSAPRREPVPHSTSNDSLSGTTSSKPTGPLSPSKRSVSSSGKPPLREPPPRPSTSLGFSDPNRRTSLHNSTQESLSNLSMALQKLSIPRVRASLSGSGALTSDSASISGGITSRPSAVTTRVDADARKTFKPSSRSISGGELSGTAVGVRRPPGLNSHSRIGLGRPAGGRTLWPPRRALSAMGPPPAHSAAVARASQAVSASASLGSDPHPSSPPSTDASQTSPSETTLTQDKRNRRASIALRSLADEGLLSREESAEAAGNVPAENDGGKMDKRKPAKLTILKNCVIYVDAKTEGGADAGELFVNMLKGLGARVCVFTELAKRHGAYKFVMTTWLCRF